MSKKDKTIDEVAPKKTETKAVRFDKSHFVEDEGFTILERAFYERALEDGKTYTVQEANKAVEAFKNANKKEV